MEKREGFWHNPNVPDNLPSPWGHGEPMEGLAAFLEALNYAEAWAEVTRYRGPSKCRLCGCSNGSTEFNLRGWTWPVGYCHYISWHNVRPSPEFQAFIEGYSAMMRIAGDET